MSVAVNNSLRTAIEAGFTVRPIVWDNPPDDEASHDGILYARISYVDGRQVSFGSPGHNLHRDVGVLSLWLMMPRGDLVGETEILAECLKGLFEDNLFTNPQIRFTRKYVAESQLAGKNGRYFATPVIVEFNSDEKR